MKDKRTEALILVDNERNRQLTKWGDQSGNELFEWMSILGEEFGELCQSVNESCFVHTTKPQLGGAENIIKEATQVAAVAVAIIEAIMEKQEASAVGHLS